MERLYGIVGEKQKNGPERDELHQREETEVAQSFPTRAQRTEICTMN